MKGILFVQAATGINSESMNTKGFTFQLAGTKPIQFDMAGESARLSILDIKGRNVFSMNMGENGFRNFSWDGMLSNGRKLSGGTYFVQVTAFDATQRPVGKVSKTVVELR